MRVDNIQVFNNTEFGQVRAVIEESEIWLIGKDITEKLEYQNGSRDINRHTDEEDRREVVINDGIQNRKVLAVNESGLYSLILGSKLSTAKKFKKWVTSEVLPTIRKHGMYATDELLNNPDLLIQVATQLKKEREEKRVLQLKIQEDKPKVLFAEALEVSDNTILIGELAKLLRQNGIDIGQNRLFERLRADGYLIRKKGESYNLPTQRAMDQELFQIKTRTINNPDGSIRTTRTTKITGKGQVYFINKFKGEM